MTKKDKDMKTTMIMTAAIAMTTSMSAGVNASELEVYTGDEFGGYAKYVKNKGFENIVFGDGSSAVAKSMCETENAAVGTLQSDAVYVAETEECTLTTLTNMPKMEVMWLMIPVNSGVEEIDDLDENSNVFVDGPLSGSRLTFRNMQYIEKLHGRSDDWSSVKGVTGDNVLLSVASTYDAAFLVRAQNDPLIVELIEAGWVPVSVEDKDINDLEWRGKSLYQQVDIKVDDPESIWNWKISTYEVPSVVAINDKALVDSKLVRTLKNTFKE